MIVADSLTRIGEQAERELDRILVRIPTKPQPSMPFEQYLPQAMAYAQQNEEFARKLARALHQARTTGPRRTFGG